MSGNEALFKQFTAHLQGHEEGLQHQAAADVLLRHAGGRACDDSVDKYTNWVFPKRSTPAGRRGAEDAQQDPVPHAGRRRWPDPHQAGAVHAHDARRPRQLPRLCHPQQVGRGLRLPGQLRPDRRTRPSRSSAPRPRAAGSRCGRPGWTTTPTTTSTSTATVTTTSSSTYYTHQKYFVIQGTYNGVPNTQHGADRLLQLGQPRHRARTRSSSPSRVRATPSAT